MAELTRRYVVMTMASEAPFDPADPEGVFVLKPWKDPAALRALQTYRDYCYPELAQDLDAWIAAIVAGPVIRGGIGQKNETYVKRAAAAAAPKRVRRTSHTKAKPRRRPPVRAKRARKGGRKKRGR